MKVKLLSLLMTLLLVSNVVIADSDPRSNGRYSGEITIEQCEEIMDEFNKIAAEYGCSISVADEDLIAFCTTVTEDSLREALSQIEIPDDDNDVVQESGSGTRTSYVWVRTSSLGLGVSLTANISGTYNHNRVTSCTGVTSFITGATLGDTYYQTSYSYNIASGGTSMTVDVYGKYNVNIFIEGIGTIVTQDIHKTFTVSAP